MEKKIIKQHFQEDLNRLLIKPSHHEIQEFFAHKPDTYKEVLFACSQNFQGKVQREIIISKVRILQKICQKIDKLSQNEVQVLVKKLWGLTKTLEEIINNSIIGICSQFSQYRQQNTVSIKMIDLFEEIQSQLVNILRSHIVLKQYKQYQKSGKKVLSNSTKYLDQSKNNKIFSQKKIDNNTLNYTKNQSDKNIQNLTPEEHLKRKIYNNVKNKSINELMSEYIQLQEAGVNQIYQTCRICLENIRIESLDEHVDYCSKISIYNDKINLLKQQKQEILQKLQQKLQQKLLEVQENTSSEDIDKNYQRQKLYRMIVKDKKDNIRSLNKRSSMLYNTKPTILLQNYINQYTDQYGEDGNLAQYQSVVSQLKVLTKKLEKQQRSFINTKLQNMNEVSSNASYITPFSGGTKSIRTKKSLFCQKAMSALSSKSSKKTIMDAQQIKKYKSIKIPCHDFGDDDDERSTSSYSHQNICKTMKQLRIKDSLDEDNVGNIKSQDFDYVKLLGKGGYGNVYLAKRKKTNDLYAIKTIKIQQEWGQEELKLIENQHEIFKKISSQYLVTAPFSFTEGACHFFVMEYVPGGDLGKVLEQQVYFQENVAKIYLAQILLAIEALHESGIIHRDLKPQNLVIDEQGHLKLTDFGLSEMRINNKISKAINNTTSEKEQQLQKRQIKEQQNSLKAKKPIIQKQQNIKIIGTPDYIAPQIINNQSTDNQSIDWWSFGVIAYQMLIGCRPFSALKVEEVIDNIQKHQIQWPQIGNEEDMIPQVTADLIKQLLNPKYRQRLGAGGAQEVKKHPFFSDIQWQNLRYSKAPILPKIEPKQNLKKLPLSLKIRAQVRNIIKNKTPKHKKLDKFVRYDLLMNQTYQSAEKSIKNTQVKLRQLKSIANNMHQDIDKKSISGSDKSLKFEKWYKSEHSIKLQMQNSQQCKLNDNNQPLVIGYFESNQSL